MRMRRTIKMAQAAPSPLPGGTKSRPKQKVVIQRCGLLALVCTLCFLAAHQIMLLTRFLPFDDMRLRTDLGGMVLAALLPGLVLAGFAGRRHRWDIILCLGVCLALTLASLLPLS